jgi:hypothetical protein
VEVAGSERASEPLAIEFQLFTGSLPQSCNTSAILPYGPSMTVLATPSGSFFEQAATTVTLCRRPT